MSGINFVNGGASIMFLVVRVPSRKCEEEFTMAGESGADIVGLAIIDAEY